MLKQAWACDSHFPHFPCLSTWGIQSYAWKLEVCFCPSSIEKLTHIESFKHSMVVFLLLTQICILNF